MQMSSAFFWDIMQRRMVILYRRLGTTYWSHLQGSRSPRRIFLLDFLALEDGRSPRREFYLDFLALEDGRSPRRIFYLDVLSPEYGTDKLCRNFGK
jgi:hypothetical protein